ncbi:hypothetical protein Poli38472_013488 [Pythium oligandrum]|uniref:Uncharacterized protein n=1 Tax=Pythium oligandrum TaxID=41045 RepID=A0A8K1C7F5_PYTOL|nr:hypothetical protein Poli38472_013488 [Pythium oligandrum]|eukprot:TMW58014.1 hypothetical protein Poli38472_013488 [Pythium oligandrum]
MGAFYTLHSLTFVMVMEGIEVICQTAQAYRMSYNVSVPWINRLFAFLTAVNCWSSPLIFALFHRHPVSERAFAMVVDAILNGIQNGVIPWTFLNPYFRDTARVAMPIDGTRFGSDLFSAQLDANIRQLFQSSWSSFFAIVAPGFLMLGYMAAIKTSIVRSIVRAVHLIHPRSDLGTTTNSVSPTPVTAGPLPPTEYEPQSISSQIGRRIDKTIHTLLFLWGFVVLACHFYTVHIGNQAKVAGRVLLMQSWMTSQYLCSLVNVSCAENQIVGRREELRSILIRMVPMEIQEFIITDCPELEVPPRIQSFLNIQLFAITNSTIVAWGMDAALKENAHPNLSSVSIVNSNLSTVPPGLLHMTPPPILGYIAFTRTNLTTLPDNVNEYWTIPYTIALEGSPGVTEVPIALGQMPWVSVIPDDFFEATTSDKLDLSGNPLTALPANLGSNDAINRLFIKDTKVELLPWDWFELYAETVGWTITAKGTPLCNHLAAGEPVITANDSEGASEWHCQEYGESGATSALAAPTTRSIARTVSSLVVF